MSHRTAPKYKIYALWLLILLVYIGIFVFIVLGWEMP